MTDTENGTRRLTLTLPTGVALALDRLARHQGQSKEEVLSAMIAAADDAIIARMAYDSPELDKYLAVKKLTIPKT